MRQVMIQIFPVNNGVLVHVSPDNRAGSLDMLGEPEVNPMNVRFYSEEFEAIHKLPEFVFDVLDRAEKVDFDKFGALQQQWNARQSAGVEPTMSERVQQRWEASERDEDPDPMRFHPRHPRHPR